ncbi:MAG: GNAT family N-acetyltransferase [Planktomarina sp.]
MAATYALCFPESRAWSAQEMQKLLDDPQTLCFGDNAAFLIVSYVLDEAEILTLAVHPNQRRKGKALDLLHICEATLLDVNVTRLFLEVAEDNDAAHALYKKGGFKTIGRRKGYYKRSSKPSVDALILEKHLPHFPAQT